MASSGKYCDITITYNPTTGVISVDPDKAYLNWVTGPDSARWRAGSSPARAASFDIEFEGGNSPLRDSGLNIDPSVPALIGTGNTHVKGYFKYSVVFRDAEGNEIAREDPGLQNDDTPP